MKPNWDNWETPQAVVDAAALGASVCVALGAQAAMEFAHKIHNKQNK